MTIPKEPRQQMINLMYLFLTAMLALNVSAEILNAFSIVNEGLDRSIVSIMDKNDQLIAGLEKKAADDPTAEEEYQAALKAQRIASASIEDIDTMIAQIYREVGTSVTPSGETALKNPGDLEVPTNYMINDGQGKVLRNLIETTKDSFSNLVEGNASVINSLPLEIEDPPVVEGKKQTWEEYNFYGVPAVAAVTLLTKMKNDLRNAESTVLEYLSNKVVAGKITFDVLTGRAISEKSYLTYGEDYEADIFVSATSQSTDPVVHIGTLRPEYKNPDGSIKEGEIETDEVPLQPGYKTIEEAQGGIVKYTVPSPSEGPKKYEGVVEIFNPNTGNTAFYPFEEEYTVSKSMAVVSAEKMNVLYVGVENPVSATAPGYQADQLNVRLRGPGSIKPRNEAGKYTVEITDNKDIVIEVWGDTKERGVHKIGEADFRGKNIPTPSVYVGNTSGGAIKVSEFRAASGIYALAENFDFEANFKIKSFELTYKKARQNNLIIEENKGGTFNETVLNIVRNAGRGDRVWLDEIKIGVPDGTTRTQQMSLKIF